MELSAMQWNMLRAVQKEAGGNAAGSAKMWPIGESLGLDRARTEDLAMDLVAEGLLEIKSLSGSLSLTPSGLALVGDPSGTDQEPDNLTCGGFALRLEKALGELGLNGVQVKNLQADVKVLKAQEERSEPLAEVVAATFKDIQWILAFSSHTLAKDLMDLADGLAKG